ncbi:MAG: hypothetical protein LBD23_00405 [Oscillospiraceae bacterium]|nr:hypothetical protein [Oscillospiraceae bacterium]
MKKKSITVYLLQISVYDDSIGFNNDVLVGEWHYNDVFTTIKKAVAVGKKELLRKLKELKSQIYRNAKIDEIVENGVVCYEFYVYEFDPDVKRSRVLPWARWNDYARWDFDYTGKLRSREENKSHEKDGKAQFSMKVVNPGDEKEDAGSKFNLGDFVKVDSQWDDKGLIYVVDGTPGKKREWLEKYPNGDIEAWENQYSVSSIDSDGLFTCAHPHEMNICLYDSKIPDDHPLQLLRKYFIGEIYIDHDVWEAVFCRQILFDCSHNKKSWRDIPELYEQFSKNTSSMQHCNMVYEILPRWKAGYSTEKADAPDTAIISITDPESLENSFEDQAWIKGILRLEFDDVEDNESVDRERYIHMNEEQAEQIVDFAYKHYNDVKRFLIHCEAGASRSAAVAVALSEHFEKHDNNIWNDRRYFPNNHVYSLLKTALRKKHDI